MNKVLYLSLSGMTESLGRSQVLEYLIDLSKDNEIFLISFERQSDIDNMNEVKYLVEKNNINWTYFNYSNKYGIFSTLFQIIGAVTYASTLIKKNKINIVHSRSMIPATMGLLLSKIYKVKHLFDIRGFVFDEKVDSGRLKERSLLYNSLKKLESLLYESSDHIVTLTQRSKSIITTTYNVKEDRISVIPTCANKDIFKRLTKNEKSEFKKKIGFENNDIILIHSGAITNSYDFDSEVKVFKSLNKINRNIKFLILNQGQHDIAYKIFEKYQIPKNKFMIDSSLFTDVYKYLNIADASLFFIPPTYSKQASAPTKFAENLLCHLPSITNSGVGDMDKFIKKYNVGCILDLESVKQDNISNLCSDILNYIYDNKINKEFDLLFNKYFDKAVAVENYNIIYKKLGK